MATQTWNPGEGRTINLSAVDMSREILPKGTYPVRVEDCTYGESAAGNPMITFKLKTESTGQDDEEASHVDKSLWYFCTLNQSFGLQALVRAFQAFQPEGIDPDNFDPETDCSAFEGCRGQAKVAHRKDKQSGEMRENVQTVLPLSGDSIF